MTANPDIVEWAQSRAGFYLVESKKPIVLASHQSDILRHCFTPGPDGRLPYETIVYSCPKKSGKTTLAALVALYFALYLTPADGELYLLANDLEQSQGRTFADATNAIRYNPILSKRSKRQVRNIILSTGTIITALPNDYAGNAGSRHSLTVWDELWAYVSENSRRLWDELTPIPTLLNSVRFVCTYAGFSGESELLEGLYEQGQNGQAVPELAHILNGEGEPACRASGRTFVYWDYELKPYPGLAISPKEYHKQQKADLRPEAFSRIHMNKWASSAAVFVQPEAWRACQVEAIAPLTTKDNLIVAVDAGSKSDNFAIIGVTIHYADASGEQFITRVRYARRWEPPPGREIIFTNPDDLEDPNTPEGALRELTNRYNIFLVAFDPFQMISLKQRLAHLARWKEFNQNALRLVADKLLYDAINGRAIQHDGNPSLSEHILNANALISGREENQLRLVKRTAGKKIDLAVALSMANYWATHYRELIADYGELAAMEAGQKITPLVPLMASLGLPADSLVQLEYTGDNAAAVTIRAAGGHDLSQPYRLANSGPARHIEALVRDAEILIGAGLCQLVTTSS